MIDMGVISGIAVPVGLIGVAVPVGLIGVAALALPLALTPRGTRSQKRLFVSVLLSALGLFVLGGALFAFLYEVDGVPVIQTMRDAPGQMFGFLARRAALASLILLPLLGLAWLSLACRVEQIKSDEAMRHDFPDQDT
ncbi:hypothetical protein [Celeribacter sp.]|uniref:hypothetical protein n=1 Tax=Celeribacter sp. TaxID=1890673 RepID=UPI003A8CD441